MPRLDWVDRVHKNIDKAKSATTQIDLVFDGDSITDGWQGAGKQVWAAHYAKVDAFDFAINGDRTEHLLWRLSAGQAQGLHPKLIALLIGTNNLGENTPEQIADGVQAIIKQYQADCPQAVILLQALFPRGELPTDPARAKIKAVNDLLAKFNDGTKVVYIDFGDKFLSPDGTISHDIMPDFLHPNAKGYQIWADSIQPMIDKYCPAK